MRVRGLEILGGVLLLGLVGGPARGGDGCVEPVGHLVSIQGEVEVQEAQRPDWRAARLDEPLCAGDEIRVGPFGRAEAALINHPKFRIDQNTRVRLVRIPVDQPALIRVLEGAVYFFSRRPRVLEIDTPFVNAMVEGTEFLIRVDTGATLVAVLEGRVAARNDRGELELAAGESALAEAGRAPVRHILVRPRDAVQWALYYPPILLTLADRSGTAPADLAEPLGTAVALAGKGDPARAFVAFETVPAAERGPEFHLHRAAALLGVGRVGEARADIDRALGQDPASGLAYGLRAVIAVARNERDQALDDARRAVDLSPRSAAARIALSYAQQARFELEDARRSLEQAVADEPRNALAHARLAELWLMLGDRRRAIRAAKKGRELAPELERVQTVLGFARLAAIDTERAKKAFRRAIALDSASPLPRFGLGLARIRESDLAEGRGDIEIAVALDPENALLRSYLGKAYFEERTGDPVTYVRELFTNFPNQENTLAAEQFAIAQRLDPNDPTSYFYDAIRKQSENRPVEALRDLEKSIELNDNRAVYRSRQLLDSDRAGRGASLARIYNDLGFAQLGINEATKSLAIDPSNASAHRFLSDVYAAQPRREIARVSELLQAQLLQDININPVQPSLSETGLNIFSGGGPARIGFNEFTPLFERNKAQLNVAGEVGSNDTRAEEVVVSGVYDRFSLSAGQFHYQTDGFRRNSDIQHDIYNIFAQAAITPDFNVQFEGRRRRSDIGDLRLDFDPDVFSRRTSRYLHHDFARLGARWSVSPDSILIASFIANNRDERLSKSVSVNDDGIQFESQHLFRGEHANVATGVGIYDIDRRRKRATDPGDGISLRSSITHRSFYIYPTIRFPQDVNWTIGFSYDSYHERDYDRERLNPKLGVGWDVTDGFRLRAAFLRTIKRALVSNRTIEPTHVAGFNQFFDDINGTETWRYGVGLDVRLADNVYAGMEVVRSDLDSTFFDDQGQSRTVDLDEGHYSSYLYWTPSPEWTVSGQIQLASFDSDGIDITQIGTFAAPMTVRYFSPEGFFGGFGGTFVRQDVNRSGTVTSEGSESFFLIDAALGYRFPQRRSRIALEARNLLNADFRYQDDIFRTAGDESQISPYIPERTVMARLIINF